MAITVTHPFVSAVADGADTSVVRPSNWNASHTLVGTVDIANGGTGSSTSAGAPFALKGANTDLTSVALTTGTVSTTPSAAFDLANKSYVDTAIAGLNFHASAQYATAAALAANTYNNGTAGVGATLTGNAVGALTVDSNVVVVAQRILVKNEVAGANNGVYVVTTVGNGSTAYVLTRATDFNTSGSGSNQVGPGDYVYVTSGTANANTAWVQQTQLPIVIGTTALVFTQFGVTGAGGTNTQVQYNASGAFAGSANLTFNGTTLSANALSLTTALPVASGGTGVTTSTGTGSTVLSASPTFTGTLAAAAITASTTLGVTGTSTLSGNAIISVTDNANAALRITQLGTGNALLVEDSTNPDASPFAIDANGFVLAGSTTGYGITGVSVPRILSVATDQSAAVGANNWGTNTGAGATIQLLKSSSGTIGTRSVVANGTTLGMLRIAGDDGTNFIEAARIEALVDGTPGTNDMPGRLVFSTTADGASSPTERMRIDSSGNVRIGASGASTYLFNAVDTTAATAAAILGEFVSTAVPTGESISWVKVEKGANYGGAIGGYLIQGVGGGLLLGTQSGSATPTERMRIDSTGLMKVPGGISGGTF